MTWEFKEQQFSSAVQARLATVPMADKVFIAALLGIDQAQLSEFTNGSGLTVDRLAALVNLTGSTPGDWFQDV